VRGGGYSMPQINAESPYSTPEALIVGMLGQPRDPAWVLDPYPAYSIVRQYGPYRSALGMWIVSRYEDVDSVLRYPGLSQATKVAVDARIDESQTLQSYTDCIVHLYPPVHEAVRGVVHKAFTKRNLEKLRAFVQRVVEELTEESSDMI